MINAAHILPRRQKPHSPPRRVPNGARRRAAIARYEILDTGSEADFDNIAKLAAQIFGTPFAAISFIDDDRQWFKAEVGLGICETPIEQSFCAFAIRSHNLFVVKDASRDPRFADNPLVTGPPHIRFYAGMKIVAKDGTPIASLCVLDTNPRPFGISGTQRMTLEVLATQVQSLLELRRSLIDQGLQVAAQSALSERLRYVADHDELTGLPHRGVFNSAVGLALRAAGDRGTRIALMLVDVDHFKQVNDALGHDAGDALLRSFARRLRSTVRSSDTVARLGGDEFGILLAGFESNAQLDAMVRSLSKRLQEPVQHAGRMIDCRASIGVSIFPDHGTTAAALIKSSDLALAAAKVERSCAVTFTSAMAKQFECETEMLAVARAGLAEQRILPFYQPKIDLVTGRLVGFEALVRCAQRDGEPLLPEAFAHAFFDRELATSISERMLEKVLADLRHWVDLGLPVGHVAINACAADFKGDNYAERLLDALRIAGLSTHMIEIEVTEGVFLGRGAHFVERALCLLSQNGMRIALDDFGTGYASLTHLKQFPVDTLKIDRSFIAGIGKSPDDTAIVRALIGLGQSLGIATVAEGVETVQQASFIRSQGCDVGQGFLYGHACPASAVPALVHDIDLVDRVSETSSAIHSAC